MRCLYMHAHSVLGIVVVVRDVGPRQVVVVCGLTSSDISANAPITKTSTRPPVYLLSAVAKGRNHATFLIGKPFVRQPRGDTRVTPEDKRRAVAQRAAAEIAERRAVFDANSNAVHWHPCTRRPELDVGPPSAPGRAWG